MFVEDEQIRRQIAAVAHADAQAFLTKDIDSDAGTGIPPEPEILVTEVSAEPVKLDLLGGGGQGAQAAGAGKPPEPVPVIKVLRAAPTSDDAFITKNISSLAEVWLTFELGAHAAAHAYWTLAPTHAPQFGLILSYGDGVLWGATGGSPDPGWRLRSPWSSGYSGVSFPADSWIMVELHVHDTANVHSVEVYLNGTLADSGSYDYSPSPNPWYPITSVELGEVRAFEDGNTDDFSYFKNVKIGTTQGGTDILEDDFSTNDFSQWDSTYGDVTIVDAPF